MSRQPSWEKVAHLLATRVFDGYCTHNPLRPDACPGCADREALNVYETKCEATGRELKDPFTDATAVRLEDLETTD